jgi:4'-phosphopantetheinyl transferase
MVPMNVYWLEQTEADVPTENDWLNERELLILNGFRVPKRRADWRLGRWTAKRAVAASLSLPGNPQVFATIEVRPACSGAPEIFFCNSRAGLSVSLSHCSGTGLCAVASPAVKLGCDLELIESRHEAFITDYFTDEERALISRTHAADKARLSTLLWSAKESALKALHEGLRLDTRSVAVKLDSGSGDLNGWSQLQVSQVNGNIFRGWWQINDNLVRTLVGDSGLKCPTALKDAAESFDNTARCA